MRRKISRKNAVNSLRCLALGMIVAVTGVSLSASSFVSDALAKDSDVITLRVCNWEEYIDEGDWDEEETIDLDNGDIIGVNPIYEEFSDWYFEQTGKRVEVEYSCFGTNEELYNMLTIGDEYDLVCPSDYMIMKLMAEGKTRPFSDEFFDEEKEDNYYIKGVSPYIREVFEKNEIGGEPWSKYAAGYMWGVTGILYNPDEVTRSEASSWNIIANDKFYRQVTVKDNVRDTYFAALGAIRAERFLSKAYLNDPDYSANLMRDMNDVSEETLAEVLDYLQDTKDNVYSFETDSGKADMITGKVLANYQWSGDAVYAMDQAEEDDYYLEFAVPEEVTDLWFDGWVILDNKSFEDPDKQAAAEAFINFLSIPENVVRNMYYIGYTSVIAGGDDDTIFQYLDWTYGAEEDEEDVVEYPVGYFFTGDDADEDYIITAASEQINRQLFAQLPPQDVINRSVVMDYFDEEENARVNQMWINVRCFNIKDLSVFGWIVSVLVCVVVGFLLVKARKLN